MKHKRFKRETWSNFAASRPLRFFLATHNSTRSPLHPQLFSLHLHFAFAPAPYIAAIATLRSSKYCNQETHSYLAILGLLLARAPRFFSLPAAVTFRRVFARLAAASLGSRSRIINDITATVACWIETGYSLPTGKCRVTFYGLPAAIPVILRSSAFVECNLDPLWRLYVHSNRSTMIQFNSSGSLLFYASRFAAPVSYAEIYSHLPVLLALATSTG